MEVKTRTLSIFNQNDLEYIQIDHNNKIVGLTSDMHITEASSFLSSLTPLEENLGGEINNFFLNILPENKEGEVLKVIIAIANKTKIDKNVLHTYLTNILNRKEEDTIILNREISEEISLILRNIVKNIKKKSKVKNYEELKTKTQNYMNNFIKDDILSLFKTNSSSKSTGEPNKKFENINNNLKEQNNNDNTNEIIYEYKEIKAPKELPFPVEMIILLRKFSMTKSIRLTVNNDFYSNDNSSNSNEHLNNQKNNELENIILILLNLDWLFPSLVNLEFDLSNINLIESQINLYKYSLDAFSKLINKEIKITTYQTIKNNRKENEPLYKSIFPQFSFIEEDEVSTERTSTSINNTNQISIKEVVDYTEVFYSDEKYNQKIKQFIKKYTHLMELIIIYGYFIGKMENIINAKLIMPLNIGEETSIYLKNNNIFINEFHILSFVTKKNFINLSIDFNCLDAQTFEKVLNILSQNDYLCKCNISFFPEEEFFKTELLYKLLQSSDENFKLKKHRDKKLGFNPNAVFNTKVNESLDDFILRKLSDYFEKNMQYFFYLLTMKTNIIDLSLIFNIPTLIVKNGYYNNVLMKFLLNIFIFIDSPFNDKIQNLSLILEKFIFDSRKYPILNDFCDKINLYTKKSLQMQRFTFQSKIYRMTKIYRFIPYNLIYLSIGTLDYETLESLVNYLTSADFGIRTKLNQLKISLNNSLIDINHKKLNDVLIRLFTEYPKGLKEISLFTFLIVSYEQINNILKKTNYSTLPYIFLQFSLKSIMNGRKLEDKLDLNNEAKNLSLTTDSFIELRSVKRENELTNKIINLLINLEKINKDILQYDIFSNIEKFLSPNEKKNVTIKFQ